MYRCIYSYTYICVYLYVCIHKNMYVYVICMCVYIYVCVCILWFCCLTLTFVGTCRMWSDNELSFGGSIPHSSGDAPLNASGSMAQEGQVVEQSLNLSCVGSQKCAIGKSALCGPWEGNLRVDPEVLWWVAARVCKYTGSGATKASWGVFDKDSLEAFLIQDVITWRWPSTGFRWNYIDIAVPCALDNDTIFQAWRGWDQWVRKETGILGQFVAFVVPCGRALWGQCIQKGDADCSWEAQSQLSGWSEALSANPWRNLWEKQPWREVREVWACHFFHCSKIRWINPMKVT